METMKIIENMSESSKAEKRIVFATHVFEHDYDIVLKPARVRMILESLNSPFSSTFIFLNNFKTDRAKKNALSMAKVLVNEGLISHYLDVHEVLTPEALNQFGLDFDLYWKGNPYYSAAQLGAITCARREAAAYVLHMTGDVHLTHRAPKSITKSFTELFDAIPSVVGINLCRNIYVDQFPKWADEEHEKWWLSNRPTGFSISDWCYCIRTAEPFRFAAPHEPCFQEWTARMPQHALGSFEMLLTIYQEQSGLKSACLRPSADVPTIRHRNFAKGKLKRQLYWWLGHYRANGRFGTRY